MSTLTTAASDIIAPTQFLPVKDGTYANRALARGPRILSSFCNTLQERRMRGRSL
jgi:hypothetical protein